MMIFDKEAALKKTRLTAKAALIGQAGQMAHDVMTAEVAVGGNLHGERPARLAERFDALLDVFYKSLEKRQNEVFDEAETLAKEMAETSRNQPRSPMRDVDTDDGPGDIIPGLPANW